MDDVRVGAAFRAVRIKRRWRQADLAARSGWSAATISRIERGHLDTIALRALRAVAAALDIRVDVTARWRAGDLDRLLNAKHSALHDAVASMFRDDLPEWVLAPETSFAVYGERGIIDIVAWHPGRRALLIIELKTDISDVNELVGTVDRKRRLAREVVRERGWDPLTVSTWVIVAPGRTNRARVAAHGAMLRAAFPADGRTIRGWLQDPVGSVAALSIWRSGRTAGRTMTPVRRVRARARVRVGGRAAGRPDRVAAAGWPLHRPRRVSTAAYHRGRHDTA
ncbi:MAG: helix-turn-helix transcriptional regulator [Chloroflexota bacterium]